MVEEHQILFFRTKICSTISSVVSFMIKSNSKYVSDDYSTLFDKKLDNQSHSSFEAFLLETVAILNVSIEGLIYSFALVDKFCILNNTRLTENNVRSLFMVSLVISRLIYQSRKLSYQELSSLGIKNKAKLEFINAAFLEGVKYDIEITNETLQNYTKNFLK